MSKQAQKSLTQPHTHAPTTDGASVPGDGSHLLSNALLQELWKQLSAAPSEAGGVAPSATPLQSDLAVGMLPAGLGIDEDTPLGSLNELLGLSPHSSLSETGEDECIVPVAEPVHDVAGPRADSGPAPSDTYCSQRDNRSAAGITAEGQCSPTSLTMSILALYDHNTDRFWAAITPLLEAEGQKADPTIDPEEALVALMLATDWEAAFQNDPAYFEHNPAWQAGHPGSSVIKNPMAQAWTASRFDVVTNDGITIASTATTVEGGESAAPMSFDERWDWTLEALERGGEVSFEGDFTDSGHVVKLVDMSEERMVVHDPYGMHLPGGYLRNGEAPAGPLSSRRAETFATRSHENPALGTQLQRSIEEGSPYDRWGERNAFSKMELQALDALKWVLVLEPEQAAG